MAKKKRAGRPPLPPVDKTKIKLPPGWTLQEVEQKCAEIWGYVRLHYMSLDADRHTQRIVNLVCGLLQADREDRAAQMQKLKAQIVDLKQELYECRRNQGKAPS